MLQASPKKRLPTKSWHISRCDARDWHLFQSSWKLLSYEENFNSFVNVLAGTQHEPDQLYNEGNEWENPKTAGLEDQLKSNLEKMLRDRAATLGVDSTLAESLITFINTLYSMRFEPGLKSMLTDINQYGASDKRLESRTDDLNAVLRLKR